MSAIFDLDTDGQGALAEQAKERGISIDQVQSGFFHAIPKAIGMGIMLGGAEAADTIQTFGRFFDEPGLDQQPTDDLAADIHHSSVDYWTPGANEVGTAGKILGGFSEIVLPLMATGGNPSLLIGSAVNKTGKQLVDQGVDASAATKAALVQGAATAAGFRIPFLGNSLLTRMASGAVGNLAVNAGSSAATQQILKRSGYNEQAQQFDPMDLESRAIDVLSGLAFGGLAHLATPSLRDSVATVANAKHFQQDTAPGIPADITSSIAHQDALEAAIRDTLQGKPVDLSGTGVMDADFIALPRPFGHLQEVPEELKGVDEAANESLPTNPERVELPPTAEPAGPSVRFEVGQEWSKAGQEPYRVVEVSADGQRAKAQFGDNGTSWVHHDTEIDNSWSSKSAPIDEKDIVNPIDRAAPPEQKLEQLKALTAENVPNVQALVDDLNKALPGTQSKLSAKEDAKILEKAARPEILKNKPWHGVEHIRDALRFKTVIDSVDQLPQIVDTLKQHGVQVVKVNTGKVLNPGPWGWRIAALDLRMPNGQLVEHYMPLRELEAAKKAGNHDLFDKWRNRDTSTLSAEERRQMLKDMAESKWKYQAAWDAAVSRTGLDETAARASLKSFSASAESLTGNQSAVSPTFQPAGEDHLPSIRTAHNSGASTSTASDSRSLVTRNLADMGNTSSRSIPETGPNSSDPVIRAAFQALTERDFPIPTGETDADGNPVYRSAREVMAESEADIAQAKNDAKGFDALVGCILTNGEG